MIVNIFSKRCGNSMLVAGLVLMAISAVGADVKIEGQVICCEDCWNKADRAKVKFGTTADLAKSAGCIANGDPTLLAVQESNKTVLYQLEQGRSGCRGLIGWSM